jgi:predicted phosphodiesterase
VPKRWYHPNYAQTRMCRIKQATFAVLSDLHCRLSSDDPDSYLIVGGLRSPSNRHPVQALIDLIDQDEDLRVNVDALLVPGDLTNKCRREGLNQGWDYSLEIGRALKASSVIPVIGNHDIDSYRLDPENSVFHLVRNLRPGFPFQDNAAVQSFFSDGFCILKTGEAEIIAINTVIDQTDKVSAKRGGFTVDRIVKMETALRGRLDSPIRGALMHHHPVLHTGTFLQDTDVIPTGDALLSSLRELGCRFVIHGHKHFSRLSYVDGIAVLASGSFSAALNEYSTAVANTFHLVQVAGNEPNDVRGTVHTWVFRYGRGWGRANLEHAGFPYLAGFGRTAPLTAIVHALRDLSQADPAKTRYLEQEVLGVAPDAQYLSPAEREDVNRALVADDLKLADYDEGKLEMWRKYRP